MNHCDQRRMPEPSRRSLALRLSLWGLGTLCLGLGILGVFLPVLPTTPFLLGAAFCYARSSRRFYEWLMRRRFIAARLEEFRTRGGLTARTKWSIFGVAFAMMAGAAVWINKPLMYLVLGILLGLKGWYFYSVIPTLPPARGRAEREERDGRVG
jgi:uncharacterized membrane protein YbaN (DUF454 family)